jgi:hypothetical protein
VFYSLGYKNSVFVTKAYWCQPFVVVILDPSKIIQRLLRGAILVPHTGKYGNPKTYITIEPDRDNWRDMTTPFLRNWDHYPNHYVIHFIHATEIIGYHGPLDCPVFGDRWLGFYFKIGRA